MHDLRILATATLNGAECTAIRRLMDVAFDDFTDEDWSHALGGWHVVIADADDVVAHASVVQRTMLIGAQTFRSGYVEAVAVRPDLQRTGLGSRVMVAINEVVRQRFELGVLSTGRWSFYERTGWERWRGPTYVRTNDGKVQRTPDEDDGVMVLRVGRSVTIDRASPITCQERAGDSW